MRSLKGLQRKLYPYQRAGVQRFFETGRLLLADDMGLGKTMQAIAACHGLFEARRVQRGLLIVPASLKSQWKREWDASTRVPLLIVEGSPDERVRQYASTKRGFLIIGYEQLLRDFEQVTKFAPELVVLDEAQRIKNWATKSAAYVKALAPQFRLVLTGTPMENRYDELASIMDFVDDLALEPKWRLTPLHSMSEGNAARGTSGAKNLTVLRERLAPVMLRRLRKDVLAQLPARVDTRVPVELTSVQREAHEDLRRPIARILQSAAKRPLRQPEFLQLMQLLARQRMICNGMAQVHFEEDWPRCQTQQPTPTFLEGLFAPKLAALRGVIEPLVIAQRRKAIVFSQWRNMLRLCEWAVRDQLAAAGLRAMFFTGAESARQREQAIVAFHDDPSVAVLFLSDAGGVGLNLQRAASCCINLELPWNPAVLEQRIGRIYRLGQTQPIDVYNLVSEDCIESRIAALVERKRAVFSGLFDGTTDEVNFGEQTSFLEGIKKLVDPVAVPVLASDDVDVQEPVAVSDDVVSAADSADKAAPAPLAGLVIERLDDGSLRIAAPAQLAAPLAELFDQLARGLRAASASER
jgi:SNF2 family DNA or RNA helicase